MGGPDTLRGMDYQISFSLFMVLRIIMGEIENVDAIQFDSITEDEEDFNLYMSNGNVFFYQIKKRNEEYLWNSSTLKPVFKKFVDKYTVNSRFFFITNGSGNSDVVKLKKSIELGNTTKSLARKFLDTGVDEDKLLKVINTLNIHTRFFQASDDANPAASIEKHTKILLNSYPLYTQGDSDLVYNALWKYTYQMAMSGEKVKISYIINDFKQIGLLKHNELWSLIPEVAAPIPRDEELLLVKNKILQNKLAILTGISGVGKSAIAAEIASEFLNEGKDIFWFNFGAFNTLDNFKRLFSGFLGKIGFEHLSKDLNSAEYFDTYRIIANAISSSDAFLVFDGFELCTGDLKNILMNTLESIYISSCNSKILITSTDVIRIPCQSMSQCIDSAHITINGLKGSSLKNYLISNDILLKDEQISLLLMSTSGYPISIKSFVQLCKQDKNYDFDAINKRTKLVTHDYFLRNVLDKLPHDEKSIIFPLSLLNYEFIAEEIVWANNTSVPVKILLKNLSDKSLLIYNGFYYHIHDVVKECCAEILTDSEKEEFHKDASLYLRNKVFEYKEQIENSIPYSIGFKWAFHTERSRKAQSLSEVIPKILTLEEPDISALWDIERYGYPFDFTTEDLSYSESRVGSLQDCGLIEYYGLVDTNDSTGQVRLYKNVGFSDDFFDSVFLAYLCISKGLSYHLGYMDIHSQNFSFEKQCHVICHWEHCIELYPTPPLSKKRQEEHIEFIKRQFEQGAYKDKTTDQVDFLKSVIENGISEDALDEGEVSELEKLRCPIFGHCCPGGEEQAYACASEDMDENS